MRFAAGCGSLFFLFIPLVAVTAQETDTDEVAENKPASFPLEITIRPPRKVKQDGFYDNAIFENSNGLRFRFSGYHVGGMHKRIIDGKLVIDIWEKDKNLLTYNVLKEAGLDTAPNFEERMAHELIYGNDIGRWMGGKYKNLSFLEIAHTFNIDPTPPPVGFGYSILNGHSFNVDYDPGNMMFGEINLRGTPQN